MDPSSVICKSCGAQGHSTKRNKECPNHNLSLEELLTRDLGRYERYTVSITMDSFIKVNEDIQPARNKIILLSSFLREVVLKAQLFINYYILQGVSDLSTDLFDQTFWYRVCRVIYGRLTIENLQGYYPRLQHIQTVYEELIQADGVNLTVNLNGLQNYGIVISSACKTIATTYNNYYVENFERIIANYFIYITRSEFRVRSFYYSLVCIAY